VENNEQFDKEAFLQLDDWRVNLTRFSDDEYWKYVAVFELLRWYYHPPKIVGNIKQIYQDENSEWVVETKCAHCGKINVYRNARGSMFRQSYFTLLCGECNHRSIYYCRKERLQNWDMLEYLCRMVATAKDEHDFKEAVDTLYMVYMETRDPENPFPKILEGIPIAEK